MYEFLRSYQNILENFDTEKNYFAWGVSKNLKRELSPDSTSLLGEAGGHCPAPLKGKVPRAL